MFISFGLFLHGVVNFDLSTWKILPIHLSNSNIRAVEVVIADKAMAFAVSWFWIPRYFGTNNHTKIAESLVQQFLVHIRVQIANEDVSPNILGSFVLWSFVDFERFSVQLNHMHDLDGIVCIFLTFELNKTVPLMLIGNLVSGDVDINNRTTLRKQLP